MLFAALLWPQGLAIQAQEPDQAVFIQDVTVIDVIAGKEIPAQSILIRDGVIAAIKAADNFAQPDDTTLIEGSGKFAIPGLWDMHIHWYDQRSMALFPLNGVTGVRMMWGMPLHGVWKSNFKSGTRLGPRIHMAGPIVDGPDPIWPQSLIADSDETALAAVAKSLDLKADFIKVYSLLPRDAYFAIARECKKKQIPFSGHVPRMVTAREASQAGQHSMEHLYELLVACSSEEDKLRKMIADHVEENDGKIRSSMSLSSSLNQRALNSFDEQKAKELFKLFAKNRTWQCPTLTVLRNMAYLQTPEVQENENLKYFPAAIRNMVAPTKLRWNRTEEQVEASQKEFEFLRRLLPVMHENGVPLIAGTDVLNPYCLPGFSLHDELQLFVDSGLKPVTALQAATINAARFMGQESRMGSIQVGKVADVVLLNDNPLQQIANTKKIATVIYQGKIFNRDALDSKLGEFESVAKKSMGSSGTTREK